MVVLSIANCPPSLRGDLSKWMNEINTGVYIGKLSARVRQEIWERTCDNIRDGQATMIYSAANAQGYAVLVHNSSWEPVDFDGITLMRRPLKEGTAPKSSKPEKIGTTEQGNAATSGSILTAQTDSSPTAALVQQKQKKYERRSDNTCVILDLETTGLKSEENFIIEIGAIKSTKEGIQERYQCLVKQNVSVPEFIANLTGITDNMLRTEGIEEKDAIEGLIAFIGSSDIVGYNVKFDMGFIRAACSRHGIKFGAMKITDVLWIAKRKIQNLENYRLETVARHFWDEVKVSHRALSDCELLYRVYSKLNEN